MSNNIQKLQHIAIDMAEGMNIIAENYNALISIEEKVINLQKDVNDIRSKSYMSQNLLEKCFERLGEMIVRTEDVTPQNLRVPLTTHQRAEYLWVSRISIPPYRVPFTGIQSGIYILEKDTNLSKQFIRVRVTTLLYTKYCM